MGGRRGWALPLDSQNLVGPTAVSRAGAGLAASTRAQPKAEGGAGGGIPQYSCGSSLARLDPRAAMGTESPHFLEFLRSVDAPSDTVGKSSRRDLWPN